MDSITAFGSRKICCIVNVLSADGSVSLIGSWGLLVTVGYREEVCRNLIIRFQLSVRYLLDNPADGNDNEMKLVQSNACTVKMLYRIITLSIK